MKARSHACVPNELLWCCKRVNFKHPGFQQLTQLSRDHRGGHGIQRTWWLGWGSFPSWLTLAICFFSEETGILQPPGVSIHLWVSVSPISLSEQAVSHTRSMSAGTWPHITHLGPIPAVLAWAREPKLSQRPLFLAYSLSWQCVWGRQWEEADSYVTFS